MYEDALHTMSRDQLLQTLSSLRRTWETQPWRVEEAALVAEIRQELLLRGDIDGSVDDLLHGLPRPRADNGSRDSGNGAG